MKRFSCFLFTVLFACSASAYAGCPGAHGAGSAPALSDEEVDAALRAAKFPEETIPTMRCIAQEESGKYPEAYCMDTSDNVLAWGTFQIYKLWFKECSGYSDLDSQLSILSDVQANAKCARRAYLTAKSQTGVGYNAWDVYKQGKCQGL